MYRQQNNARRACYGLLRSVPGVSDGSVFYQGPCPAKTAVRGGVCVCGCGCETPLDPCPRYAPVCFDADCLAEVTASAPDDDCDCGCGCNGCGCGCNDGCNGCCNGCGCDCNGCGCQPPMPGAGYAVLTAPGPATLADGGTFPLAIVQGGAGFGSCAGGVQVLADGTYFVAYTLNAPPLSQADAVFGLRLNGARLSESETAVQLNGAGGAACFGGQTIVTAAAGSCISLVSNGAASFPQSANGVPLATMTIVPARQCREPAPSA